jgi:hypothetical protein
MLKAVGLSEDRRYRKVNATCTKGKKLTPGGVHCQHQITALEIVGNLLFAVGRTLFPASPDWLGYKASYPGRCLDPSLRSFGDRLLLLFASQNRGSFCGTAGQLVGIGGTVC